MKKFILNAACTLAAVSVLSACSSAPNETVAQEEAMTAPAFTTANMELMSDCSLPNSAEAGPLSKEIYVVGSFPGANWKHVAERKLAYKGNNIYQIVIEEAAGDYKMQYAADQWKPQFTAEGKSLTVGQLNKLTYGGYGTDTKVEIKEAGKYLWSLEFKDSGEPYSILLTKCQ